MTLPFMQEGSAATNGQHLEVELKPGGRHIPVTVDNVQEYIHRMAHYRCVHALH